MLSRPQIILLKRAQREAGIDDSEYRDTLAQITGLEDCTSSTDPRLTDRQLDVLLAYFESICWRRRDRGELPGPIRGQVFERRGYWRGKNTAVQTSRDAWAADQLHAQISAAEQALQRAGKGAGYLDAIQQKTGPGWAYLGALKRTLRVKR